MKKRNGSIELYRFLFALVIMVRHIKPLFVSNGYNRLFGRGALGVEFFFIVSGYLMAKNAAARQGANENTA